MSSVAVGAAAGLIVGIVMAAAFAALGDGSFLIVINFPAVIVGAVMSGNIHSFGSMPVYIAIMAQWFLFGIIAGSVRSAVKRHRRKAQEIDASLADISTISSAKAGGWAWSLFLISSVLLLINLYALGAFTNVRISSGRDWEGIVLLIGPPLSMGALIVSAWRPTQKKLTALNALAAMFYIIMFMPLPR